MSKEYQELQRQYGSALAKSKGGDRQAFADKAKIMGDIRQAERESAAKGAALNPVIRKGPDGKPSLQVEVRESDSKRSLQEGYVRQFDDKVPVRIENRREGTEYVGTLQRYHRKRLFGA